MSQFGRRESAAGVRLTARFLLTIALPLVSASLGSAAASDFVESTARLNLRECPSTKGCRVIETLGPGTKLQVTGRDGVWFRVEVGDEVRVGWVHSAYTRFASEPKPQVPASGAQERFDVEAGLKAVERLLPILLLMATFLVLSFLGSRLNSNLSQAGVFFLLTGGTVVGLLFILNQFGQLILQVPWLKVYLARYRIIWEFNPLLGRGIDYSHIALGLLTIALFFVLGGRSDDGTRIAFLRGLAGGFLAVPALALILGFVALVVYLVWQLFKLVGWLLGIVAIPLLWLWDNLLRPVLQFLGIPFVWLWENVLGPVLQFLGIPFVWIWKNFLAPLVDFISIPFVWFWKVVLVPVGQVLFRFIARPLLIMVLGMASCGVAILPFACLGVAILRETDESFRGALNQQGLFGQGVNVGFLLLDCCLLVVLQRLGMMNGPAPLSLVLLLFMPALAVLRLFAVRSKWERPAARLGTWEMIQGHWRQAGLGFVVSCVLIPVAFVASLLLAGGED